MVDVAIFAALGWERRAVTSALRGVEPAERPRTWRGRLGDGASCLVVQTGMGPARARAAAEQVPAARWFLACGCAGGLVPSLVAGDLVVAAEVRPLDATGNAGAPLPAESALLLATLAAAGLRVHAGAVVSSETVLATAAAKRAAGAGGALVVEMESAALAGVAVRRGVPFAGLRVVLDGAGETLPPALALVDEATGEVRALAAAALVLKPWHWSIVARLARQSRVAERSLRRACAVVLSRGLAGLDARGGGPRAAAR
jgi:nucleoside phosphorylase